MINDHAQLKAAEKRIKQIQSEKESALFDDNEINEDKLAKLKQEERDLNKQFDDAGIDRPLR